MLSQKDLHRLRGPAQLRKDEAEKLFEIIKSFGVISGQPRSTFVQPLSPFRDLVYLTETSSNTDGFSIKDFNNRGNMEIGKYGDGPIHDWYNWHPSESFPAIKSNRPIAERYEEDSRLQDVVLAIGVHYPATPSTEFYTADGRYRFSIANVGRKESSASDLGEQLVKLATTPRNELKQTDSNWPSYNPERYFTQTRTMYDNGKNYEVGQGAWFEKSNGLLNEPAIFMESIDEAYDTNGRIFFIVGNPRVSLQSFNAINYKVIR